MIQILSFMTCFTLDVILIAFMFHFSVKDGAIAFTVLSFVVLGCWANYIICSIASDVKDQTKDMESLKQFERARDSLIKEAKNDKEAYEKALAKYKEEVENTLLETYKQFEENMMEKIKDSKLLAMAMKKSGYSDLLARYHANIVDLTDSIKKCDERVNTANNKCEEMKIDCEKAMLVRQGKGAFGHHYFFPKHLVYKEE